MRAFVSAVVLLTACFISAHATANADTLAKLGYAPVNGIKIYYEVHGKNEGIPLVLLNGGGSTIDVTYSRILPTFAQHREVIALEEQGHGRSSDRNKPFRTETSSEDVAGLLNYLKIEKVDVMGFSNGAGVAMQLAIRHPGLVHKLVYASYMTRKNGAYPWFLDFMKKADFKNMPQPLKDAFFKVNPAPEKLKNMCDKDVKSIQFTPTMIVIGNKDLVKPRTLGSTALKGA